ncbi:hypothetical protein HDU76_004897 [Blyttiomyces sp. JEL0837]|nr:hypothetical protein HDU76_004897 [Blyttiomyces sp. JEL0837]
MTNHHPSASSFSTFSASTISYTTTSTLSSSMLSSHLHQPQPQSTSVLSSSQSHNSRADSIGYTSAKSSFSTTSATNNNEDIDATSIDSQSPLSPPADPLIKRILVTGGAGFIGSHVVRNLVLRYPQYHIFNFDRLDYCSSLKSLEDLVGRPNYSFIKGDITSSDFVNYILKEHQIDTVIHLAAQSHVDNSFGDSFEFTKNNVMGTHVLLEGARVHSVRKFIHVSTDEVYGEVERGNPRCDEDTILAPSNPYSATKAAAECLVKAYFKSFNVPVVITRSNNVYGPHQYPEKIIPKFICSLLQEKKCFIHGNGANSRHYIYATDVADAITLILHKGEPGEIYNIGTDFEISNLQLARYLLLHFGLVERPRELVRGGYICGYTSPSESPLVSPMSSGDSSHHQRRKLSVDDVGARWGGREHGIVLEGESKYLEFVADRPFNDKRYAIDSSKLKGFGWRPRVSFEMGIQMTVEWYRKHANTWWDDDIVTALVPHPLKKMPQLRIQE